MPYNRRTDINDMIAAKACVTDLLLAVNRLAKVYDSFIEESFCMREKYRNVSPKVINFPSLPDSEIKSLNKKEKISNLK